MARITGALTNPIAVGLEGAKIKIVSKGVAGSVLQHMEAIVTAGAAGAYDFDLLEGEYIVYIRTCGYYVEVGSITVDANTPSVSSLQDLLVIPVP